MLIHERMLESYIAARLKFMKPGGKMFPATGTIYAAPFTDSGASQLAANVYAQRPRAMKPCAASFE